MRRHLWAAAIVGSLVLGTPGTVAAQAPPVGQPAPDVTGGPWFNSAPLTTEVLRGRVVLVEFWTYG